MLISRVIYGDYRNKQNTMGTAAHMGMCVVVVCCSGLASIVNLMSYIVTYLIPNEGHFGFYKLFQMTRSGSCGLKDTNVD